MTISTTDNRRSYDGDGSSTVFPFPIYFLANTDLIVYVDTVLQTLNTDYTVTGAGLNAGGDVTFTLPPASGDGNVVIIRSVDPLQQTSLPSNGPFPAKTVEQALDKLTMLCQRLFDRVNRSFALADGDSSGASTTLPSPSPLSVIAWDASGMSLKNTTAAEIVPEINDAIQVAVDAAAEAEESAANASNSAIEAEEIAEQFEIAGEDKGSALVAFLPSGTGAVPRTVQDKLRDVVSVKDFGAVGDGVTDDTTAINLAFAAFKASVASGAGSKLVFPEGVYKVTAPIGALDIVPYVGYKVSIIEGYGAQILVNTSALAGLTILDLRGSTTLQVNGLQILSNIAVANQPKVGIIWGRYTSTLPNNADKVHFNDVKVSGNYSVAAALNAQSEVNCYTNCQFLNSSTTSTSYAFILDGINHFNVASAFTTVTLAVDTLGSLQTPLFVGCSIQANSGSKAAVWLSSGVYSATFLSGYCLQQTANPLFELYVLANTADNAIYGLTLTNFHCENQNATYNFLITGAATTPIIQGLSYADNYNFAASAIFARDSTQTVTINNLNLAIGALPTNSSLPLFDDATKYTVTPKFISLPPSYPYILPSASTIAPATTASAITSTATFVMSGFGADSSGGGANPAVFTPRFSGKLRITVTGSVRNNTALSGGIVRIQTGTGTAPALNAANVGNVRGMQIQTISATANAVVPFTKSVVVSGFTLGTQVWVDIAAKVITSGNLFVLDPEFIIEEI